MAKRDVDSVDPARAQEIPESIRLAERWRLLGVALRQHAPEVFAKLFETLVVSQSLDDDAEKITESYLLA